MNNQNVLKILLYAAMLYQYLGAAAIDDASKQLLEASKSNNLKKVEEALGNGADVNIQDPQNSTWDTGNTPLIYAAQNGNVAMVQFLIKAGTDVNIQNQKGNTPLYTAVVNRHFDIVDILLRNGALINIGNSVGTTPLIAAIKVGPEYKAIVQNLLNAGANPNVADKTGITPLMYAVLSRYLPLVVIIVESGANLFATNSRGQTALDLARPGEIRQFLNEIILLMSAEKEYRNVLEAKFAGMKWPKLPHRISKL